MIVGHGQKKVKSREQDVSAAITETLITIFNRNALLQAFVLFSLKVKPFYVCLTIITKNF